MTKELTLNKIAAGLVGVAMVAGLAFAFAAERAHAVTLSELVELFIALEVIPADKADEARAVLSGQEETPAPGAGSVACSASFSRNLTVGDTGADVKALQVLLNANGFTVATAGAPGSAGMETMYFGPATKAAVTAMQNAFASEILTPLGLTTGTGFFGASTRAKANALCSAGPSTPPTPPTVPGAGDDDDDDDDTTSGELKGGEASVQALKLLSSPSAATIADGEEDVKVAGFSFKVKDGDVAIKRVDVDLKALSGNTGYNTKPWRVFQTAALMLGDEEIASMDVDRESDWTDLSNSNAYELRFTGLDGVVREDETAELYVVLSALSNIDTKDENTKWEVTIKDRGIRTRDGAGIDQYVSGPESRTFMTEGAGSGEKLKLVVSSSNPKASIVKVDDNNETKDETILAFDLEAKDHAIEVSSMRVTVTSGSSSIASILSKVDLVIDGVTYNDVSPVVSSATSSTSTSFVFDMSDDKLNIGKDETVKGKVVVSFKKQSGNYALTGEDITASITEADFDATDAEGASTITDLSGSAIGETHSLLTTGIFAEIVSTSVTVDQGENNAGDVATFRIKFDVTAFEDTAYVSATSGAITAVFEDNTGVTADNATNTVITTTSGAAKVTAGGANAYRVDAGDTETFEVSATYNPTASGFYRMQLVNVNYGPAALNPAASAHPVKPVTDFETAFENLDA